MAATAEDRSVQKVISEGVTPLKTVRLYGNEPAETRATVLQSTPALAGSFDALGEGPASRRSASLSASPDRERAGGWQLQQLHRSGRVAVPIAARDMPATHHPEA